MRYSVREAESNDFYSSKRTDKIEIVSNRRSKRVCLLLRFRTLRLNWMPCQYDSLSSIVKPVISRTETELLSTMYALSPIYRPRLSPDH